MLSEGGHKFSHRIHNKASSPKFAGTNSEEDTADDGLEQRTSPKQNKTKSTHSTIIHKSVKSQKPTVE